MIFDRLIPQSILHTYRHESRSMVLAGIYTGLVSPFILVTARQMGASALLISFMVALPECSKLVGLALARRMDMGSRKKWTIIPQLLGRSILLLAFFADDLPKYVAVVVLYQLVVDLGMPARSAWLKTMYPDHQRGTAMGLRNIENGIASMLSTFVAGLAMTQIGDYRWVFPIAALIGMSSTINFLFIEEKKVEFTDAQKKQQDSVGIREIFREDRIYRNYFIAYMVFGTGAMTANTFYPLVLVDVLHASNFQVGLLATMTTLFQLGGYRLWGLMIDRRFTMTVLTRTFLMWAAVPLMYLLTSTIVPSFWFLLPSSLLRGLASSGNDMANTNVILELAAPTHLSRYLSLQRAQIGVRGIYTPFLAALLNAVSGLGLVFAFGILFSFIGWAVMSKTESYWRAHRNERPLKLATTPGADTG